MGKVFSEIINTKDFRILWRAFFFCIQIMSDSKVVEVKGSESFDDGQPYEMHTFANTAEVERKLVKTLDLRLMVWAFFGYFANGLDRNNMRK